MPFGDFGAFWKRPLHVLGGTDHFPDFFLLIFFEIACIVKHDNVSIFGYFELGQRYSYCFHWQLCLFLQFFNLLFVDVQRAIDLLERLKRSTYFTVNQSINQSINGFSQYITNRSINQSIILLHAALPCILQTSGDSFFMWFCRWKFARAKADGASASFAERILHIRQGGLRVRLPDRPGHGQPGNSSQCHCKSMLLFFLVSCIPALAFDAKYLGQCLVYRPL